MVVGRSFREHWSSDEVAKVCSGGGSWQSRSGVGRELRELGISVEEMGCGGRREMGDRRWREMGDGRWWEMGNRRWETEDGRR